MTNLAQLQQLFTIYQTPPFPADSIPVTVDGQVVAIANTGLTNRERALVATLQPAPAPTAPWPRFLLGQGPAPSSDPVRLIHFTTTIAQTGGDPETWLEAFTSLFAGPVSGFFATTNRGAIVEPAGELLIDRSDLAGMLDTLDGDFDTSTRAYIGRSWPTDADLPAMYAEEVQLAAGNTARISTLQESALAYYTQAARRHSRILLALRRLLRGSTSDMAPVITALYHNQGNLTATAKALYLHRNTLQYRIEKFQQRTGFALKNMDDLVLCYLLLQGE